MKAFYLTLLLAAFVFSTGQKAQAQQRNRELKPSDYSGNVIKKNDPSDGANLGNLFNMKMTQSYSVNVGTIGGHVMNVNAFTNSMRFFFNEDLTGQVDVSLLHSPFGGGQLYGLNDTNELQVALDAQLDYQINKSMNLHFEIRRQPNRYGYAPGWRSSPFEYGPSADY